MTLPLVGYSPAWYGVMASIVLPNYQHTAVAGFQGSPVKVYTLSNCATELNQVQQSYNIMYSAYKGALCRTTECRVQRWVQSSGCGQTDINLSCAVHLSTGDAYICQQVTLSLDSTAPSHVLIHANKPSHAQWM